jgi:NAD dependent epimerase/dehydratase family enzyme
MHPGSGLARQVDQFRRGFGGPVGSGRQWQPWIHVADAAGLLLFALEDNRIQGPLNGTAPDVLRNREFAAELAKVVGKPAHLPTPGLLLRMWVGVTADTMLYGRRVLPQKALELGYQFQFPKLASALHDLVDADPSGKKAAARD